MQMAAVPHRNIILPSLEQSFLGEEGQLAEYFTYQETITEKELKKELRDQPHMSRVLEALDPERKTYLLRGKNEETLQLAVEYIGNYHRLRGGTGFRYMEVTTGEESEDEAVVSEEETVQFDFGKRLAVIDASELLRSASMGFRSAAGFGGFGYGTDRQVRRSPWWAEMPGTPLCIRLDVIHATKPLVKAIRSLLRGRLLILWQAARGGDEEDGQDDFYSIGCENALTELAFELECEPILVDVPDELSPYKQQVLRQLARDRGSDVMPACGENVIRLIQEHRKNADNRTMDKAIGNALLRRKSVDKSEPLTEADFYFLADMAAVKSHTVNNAGKNLIGQQKVREQLDRIVDQLSFQKRREALGLPTDRLHGVLAFMGAPGTGKTTWARYLAERMEERRLLENTSMICMNAAELKGMYVGHTTRRVQSIFEEYGVIILDEAYSLTDGPEGGDVFSKEALAQLCVELEEHAEDRLVIFAGYGGSKHNEDNPMARFFQANPGISSRVSFKIYFEDFEPGQLVEVFHSMMAEGGYQVVREADDALESYFSYRMHARAFGNCREARNLADRVKGFVASRAMQKKLPDKESLTCVLAEDIRRAVGDVMAEYDRLKEDTHKAAGF